MSKLSNFISTKPEIAYNEENKEIFRKLGSKFLRDVGKMFNEELLFDKHRYTYNPSGIACSGDHSWMGMLGQETGLAMYLSQPLGGTEWLMFRDIANINDHTGGQNHWLPDQLLADPRTTFEFICKVQNLGTRT